MKKFLGWVVGMMLCVSTQAFADVDYRLPSTIQPSFQQIHLNIDPDNPDYSGSTVIDIDVLEATNKVGFYQLDIDVTKAELYQGDKVIPLTVTIGDYDINWGTAASTIAAGKYQLAITFEGKVNTSSDGMYLSAFEGNNYIFTQFEDMHARRAFPSFDEPSFKIPYQMTITSPEKQTVVSNTPVETRTVENGMQTVKFMKTKKMPTYLIAYTVGPFDSAELTGLSVPGKIYVPKGYADKTKFIVKHTPEILQSLENFFGIDYPYRKLDFVAVPNFTHGAMENAGLITYRDSLLLLEDNPGLSERASPLNVVAHELAHQWYGNLVTMAWWDDLWLNEAFASWMASYVMMELYPELNFKDRIIQEGAFSADASPTTKPVKKIVRSQPDVMDGLGLNYSKGESILQMIESLIGTDNFRTGIRAYMKKHAWGNTEANDLWAALDSVSDFNLSVMMKAYLEQPGYPLLKIETDGTITQQRYHFAGAEVKAQTWAVPLNISYKKNGKIHRKVIFVDDKITKVAELAEADWVFPNDNATGYFRWEIPQAQMSSLLSDLSTLNNREKKNVLYNMQALLTAGEAGIDDVMQVLNAMAADEDTVVIRSAVSIIGDFLYLVNDDNEAAFAKLLTENFLPLLDKLTLTQGEDDDTSTIQLRNSLYSLLGSHADSDSLKVKSEKIAKQFIADTSSIPTGIAGTAIRVATKDAGADMYNALLTAFRANDLPNIKRTLLFSMRFEDPALVEKMLDLALSDDITPANAIYMVGIAGSILDDKTLFYTWLNKNLDGLVAKIPAYHLARMPEFVSSACDEDSLAKAITFYGPIKEKYEGMSRSYEKMMDGVNQCLRLKNTYQAKFDAYLASATN